MFDPAVPPPGLAERRTRALLSPWFRLGLLVVLLACAVAAVLVCRPERLLTEGWPHRLSGGTAMLLFTGAYGLCTAAFVPRPVLNLAAGALFGGPLGTVVAVVGTVLGSAVAFGLGRLLGQDALRPLLRGRWLRAADRQLSRHGFRSMLALRLFPGLPFAAVNYCAAVSRMGWLPFLLATALGCTPTTTAYVIAGGHAASPTSLPFLAATAFIAVTGAAAVVVAWRKKGRMRFRPRRRAGRPADRETSP
ncbi:hypothetical protein BLA24_07385 [Streptomyces cinnamoneus]|uniref:TVP38/TMEM64 family membrane protein n=1 Tax=Streptomyces cinnamoneus TaxID=53446 RepID=A0A2G1XMZ8_STRCJ|nr:VTT domain-containing protein [Streptomyces cinnamoneus]PHQ52583.1 hypothetical protein BLA24_07385 [Streptomyces cinnamoneus]PPT16121.1 TVP38/TMEM64 family protein [Streptomyces cinnamoneus]